ncbi:RNA-directed DNA polymerase [Paraburkholderia caribensis]|uniref:RNA-directed DNA polymerase n=1 Tax=Paraburkholderia caribensis TaxID=75105 RepID=UPI001CACF5CC|nr:RNA-directed DNA polymerase [Paraburkholderia caribensis]CAG9243852.1 Reverse transcriptase domain-containing protein [Paraburkholderia caribensis]
MLTDESLDFARAHITAFYDTDFYPKPFEYGAFWYFWDEVKEHLKKAKPAELFVGPPKAIAWPKARGGYRVVHQLEPLDAIVYVALTHSVAEQIAEARMGPEVACSYRMSVDESSFFGEGSGFNLYRARCEHLSGEYRYVLSTDISDFYNQIYLHRVGNAIESATGDRNAGLQIEQFITRLNNKASQGIPIGPAPSVVLAEAVMIDVDQHIQSMGLDHVRYVDDIRIFADSRKELERCLEDLVIYLHENHRLNVVGDKTSIKRTSEFLHDELKNHYQLEKLEILHDIEVTNPYSAHVEDDYDEDDEGEEDGEARDPGEVLLDALTRVRKFGMVDLAVIRAIIRRAKAKRIEDIAELLLREIEFFAPAANDVVLYLARLSDFQLLGFLPMFIDGCAHGRYDRQCVRIWMEWLFSHRSVLLSDRTIQKFIKTKGSVVAQATAAITTRNLAWAKSAKGKILSHASWDRRSYLHALSVLSGDELNKFIPTLLKHSAMTPTDLWVAKWIAKGRPEPKLPDIFMDNEIPF